MKGVLYLIPAPLSDSDLKFAIPENVREIAINLKYFIVEDLRTARRYLSKLKIETPIDELNFSELNEHSDKNAISQLLDPALKGNNIGVISDAGMPCIADPGEELVNYAHLKNIRVVPLVGPSSIFLALAASGLNAEKFSFEGYLSAKTLELTKVLKKIEQQSKQDKQSKIFIEAPYRSAKMFETIVNTCFPETYLSIACDITSPEEIIKTMQIKEWKKTKTPDINKKPCIFILQAFAAF